MKSDKSPLKKAVKAVTNKIRKGGAAVAAKLKKSDTSAEAKPPVAAKSKAKPAVEKPVVEAEEPPIVAKPVRAKKKAVEKVSTPSIPDILLEGDRPATPVTSGPGQRYALGPSSPLEHIPASESAELPEAYGTKRLLLTARDPHWLYARWDLTREQQKEYNRLSADKHLVLRIFLNEAKGNTFEQVHVHPESTHWFCHVANAGAKYVAELGYFSGKGAWTRISTSAATMTPPDAMSDDTSAEFATIPIEIPFSQLMEMAKVAVQQNIPFSEVVQQLRASGYNIPETKSSGKWTPERERALASIITMDRVRRVWMGSLEITELIRRQLQQEISSMGAAQFSVPTSPFGGISSITSLSSPFGGGKERGKGFWFNVNAELIIYGATEPDAEVSIGGRVIKLRPDGSFSYRFALPDGNYDLPAVAISNDKSDTRAAELKFSRDTQYRGEVGTHPQDPQLKLPLAKNVA